MRRICDIGLNVIDAWMMWIATWIYGCVDGVFAHVGVKNGSPHMSGQISPWECKNRKVLKSPVRMSCEIFEKSHIDLNYFLKIYIDSDQFWSTLGHPQRAPDRPAHMRRAIFNPLKIYVSRKRHILSIFTYFESK